MPVGLRPADGEDGGHGRSAQRQPLKEILLENGRYPRLLSPVPASQPGHRPMTT
ncbi:MAG: hypothetical protein H6667_07150 [Ardenticatenaceae bacterium]|nr:hypothetical protein [Ardenticatenaceae bacterium]